MQGRDDEHEGTPLSRSVDYKTLFMGACALVAVLGGGFFGFWSDTTQQQAQSNRDSNQRQWIKLSDIERQHFVYQGRLEILEKRTDDQEQRLRDMERQLARSLR